MTNNTTTSNKTATRKEMLKKINALDASKIADKKVRTEVEVMQELDPAEVDSQTLTKLFTKLVLTNEMPIEAQASAPVAKAENAVKVTAKKPVKEAAPKEEPAKPSLFPSVLEVDGTNYQLKTVAAIGDVEEDNLIVTYWPKKDIKPYYDGLGICELPKEFPNNLDIMMPVYIAESGRHIVVISTLTENCMLFKDSEFTEKEPGEYQSSNDMPFMIYAKAPAKKTTKK
jgi:hypothetical protein